MNTETKNDTIEISPAKGPVGILSGRVGEKLSRALSPAPGDVREMLRRLRAECRWSQSYAAAVLGVARTSICKWETGIRNPTGSAAKLICLLHKALVKKSTLSVGDLAEWRSGKAVKMDSKDDV